MSDVAGEGRLLDTHDLYVFLNRFVQQNEHANHIERRWIAAKAADLRAIALDLKSGGAEALGPELRRSVRDLRLREIAEAKGRIVSEMHALDREAASLANITDEIPA